MRLKVFKTLLSFNEAQTVTRKKIFQDILIVTINIQVKFRLGENINYHINDNN